MASITSSSMAWPPAEGKGGGRQGSGRKWALRFGETLSVQVRELGCSPALAPLPPTFSQLSPSGIHHLRCPLTQLPAHPPSTHPSILTEHKDDIGCARKEAVKGLRLLVGPGHGLQAAVVVALDAHGNHVLPRLVLGWWVGCVGWDVWGGGWGATASQSGRQSRGRSVLAGKRSPHTSIPPQQQQHQQHWRQRRTQLVNDVASRATMLKMRKFLKLGSTLISIATPPNTSAQSLKKVGMGWMCWML